eukprot:m.110816 g.110816  ORF g.110816 m.110816 type:complete len:111 (+) comp13409_c0_seq3:349-681(+)
MDVDSHLNRMPDLEGHDCPIVTIASNTNGSTVMSTPRFASSDESGVILVWDAATAKPVWRITEATVPVNGLAFRGDLLFSGDASGAIQAFRYRRGLGQSRVTGSSCSCVD